jgi:hypothetical protein
MRYIFIAFLLIQLNANAQWKDYSISSKNDTVNRIDKNDKKQGKWIIRVEENMGEPGMQYEGSYTNDEKVGKWKIYSLMGDPMGEENYNEGDKDGKQRYYDIHGNLTREENYLINDNKFDTVQVSDWKKDPTGNTMKKVVVKVDGRSMKHGAFTFYDENSRMVRKEVYIANKLEETTTIIFSINKETGKTEQTKEINKYDIVTGKVIAKASSDTKKKETKPKQVQDFEKIKKGKKKKYQDGSTG